MREFYTDDLVTLYHGDCREILPTLPAVDVVVTDPPYGETALAWDVPVEGWLPLLNAPQLWCCASMRMILSGAFTRLDDWRFAQDVVWEKHNGSSLRNDRFNRVHELLLHFYRGSWHDLYHETPTTNDATARTVRRKTRPVHWGGIAEGRYRSEDGGPRLMRSVLQVRSCHGHAIHPTEKPVGLLVPVITYSCPPGGVVLDPFAGSAATLEAARSSGRRAIGIEIREEACEKAARRLSQGVLQFQGEK